MEARAEQIHCFQKSLEFLRLPDQFPFNPLVVGSNLTRLTIVINRLDTRAARNIAHVYTGSTRGGKKRTNVAHEAVLLRCKDNFNALAWMRLESACVRGL
jgi:hypothetical protein